MVLLRSYFDLLQVLFRVSWTPKNHFAIATACSAPSTEQLLVAKITGSERHVLHLDSLVLRVVLILIQILIQYGIGSSIFIFAQFKRITHL
jgi:hypothetical protein